MSETGLGIQLRCQRCGDPMELRDPAPGAAWAPVQYWVCNRCGRHFWTTYPPPAKDKPAAATEASATTGHPTGQTPHRYRPQLLAGIALHLGQRSYTCDDHPNVSPVDWIWAPRT